MRLFEKAILIACALFLVSVDNPAQALTIARSYHAGGQVCLEFGDFKVTVPDSHKVLDVSGAPDRLLVSVQRMFEPVGRQRKYRSEVWQFRVGRRPDAAQGIEDRKVLISLDSVGGIRNEVCRYTVNCPWATAVYVKGFERGRTAVFDEGGRAQEIQWPSRFSFIRPLTWMREWKEQWGPPDENTLIRLVCVATNLGAADLHILIYDMQEGTVETLSLDSVQDEQWSKILLGVINKY